MLGTPVSLLIGLILILGSVGLFFLDKIKPAYARDSDKVYAVFILIAGILALTHWEINIGESFQMLLMAGMLTTLMIENIRTREPKLPVPTQPYDNRPPRPRYSEAPPVRRGYRAELDNRLDDRVAPGFRGDPTRAPRMAPAPAEYWGNAPRQPYEEYRGPAGRLQPSPDIRGGVRGDVRSPEARGPENRVDNRLDDRYAGGNGRYGERPPAYPSVGRPPEGYAQRPPQRPAEQIAGPRINESRMNESRMNEPRVDEPRDAQAPNDNRVSKGERSLNVRPLSEAPRLDLPAENM